MNRFIPLIPLTLVAMLWAGCGNSGSGAAGVVSTPMPNSGILVFNFVLARAVPSNVDTIEFNGYTDDARLVFGPIPRDKASQIVIEGVPLVTRTVTLDYYDGDILVARGEVAVVPARNGRTVVNDPDFTDVAATTLIVQPESATLSAGASRQLAATVTLSNGESFTLAEGATFSSSNTAVATVDNQGNVIGLSPGSAVITVAYRGLTRNVPITVVAP